MKSLGILKAYLDNESHSSRLLNEYQTSQMFRAVKKCSEWAYRLNYEEWSCFCKLMSFKMRNA